jgi:hypothetical protein
MQVPPNTSAEYKGTLTRDICNWERKNSRKDESVNAHRSSRTAKRGGEGVGRGAASGFAVTRVKGAHSVRSWTKEEQIKEINFVRGGLRGLRQINVEEARARYRVSCVSADPIHRGSEILYNL